MSQWMYPTGRIVYTGDPAQIPALLDQGDLPRGSEGPIEYEVWSQDGAIRIGLDGSLRDCGEPDDVDDVHTWFLRVCTSPHVQRAYMQVLVGADHFIAGFYYIDGVHTCLMAPREILDL